jgi:hypothetical protein
LSAVGQGLNLPQPQQSFVGGHQSQAEHLGGRGQEAVSGVRVRSVADGRDPQYTESCRLTGGDVVK